MVDPEWSLKQRFPDLHDFLVCHFHQDWKVDYKTVEEAVRTFMSEDEALVEPLIVDLEGLLAIDLSDDELRALVLGAGAAFSPPSFNLTYRAWLEGIMAILRR